MMDYKHFTNNINLRQWCHFIRSYKNIPLPLGLPFPNFVPLFSEYLNDHGH